MRSIYNFIVKPKSGRSTSSVKIDNSELLLNTELQNHNYVSRHGIILATPMLGKTNVKEGDEVILHHNVFRRFYDIRGEEKNSRSYFKDGLYFVQLNQVYLYKSNEKWKAFGDRCFISPIHNNDDIDANLEERLVGILKYGNSSLEALRINEGDLVGYSPFGEFDFVVDGKRLYCMKSNDIVIKYERQGNETEYNPSWAHSS